MLRIKFNKIPQNFRRRIREALVQSRVKFYKNPPKKFQKKIQEDLIQSHVRFNRVLEKVPEKVPEKIIGVFGVESNKIQ